MQLVMNRCDWTGNEIKVNINVSKRTFAVDGSNYRLDPLDDGSFDIMSQDHNWDKVGHVFELTVGQEWMATTVFSDLTRSSVRGPYHAAVALLCNS